MSTHAYHGGSSSNFQNETVAIHPLLAKDPCASLVPRHELITAKFVLLSVIGLGVALFGVFGNVTTAMVMTRPSMRQSSNNLYLATLAVFDTLVLLLSMMLYSMENVSEYFDDANMYVVWIQWVPHCFALSNFAQTGSVYMTVVATFERYLAVLYPKYAEVSCTRHRALLSIFGIFAFAALFNCTRFFEIVVYHHENCSGFAAYELLPSELLSNHVYSIVYTLWLSQFVMVFLPFGVLLTVNIVIVWNFRRYLKQFDCWDIQRRISFRRLDGSEMLLERAVLKEQSRDATRVLATIVLVFLICNCLGFVLTLLESIYSSELLSEQWPNLYTFARDLINFSAMFNSSINFVVCVSFGEDFRCELAAMFGCTERRRRLQSRRRRQFSNTPKLKRTIRRRRGGKSKSKSKLSRQNGSTATTISDAPSERSPLHKGGGGGELDEHEGDLVSLNTLYQNADFRYNGNRPYMFERLL